MSSCYLQVSCFLDQQFSMVGLITFGELLRACFSFQFLLMWDDIVGRYEAPFCRHCLQFGFGKSHHGCEQKHRNSSYHYAVEGTSLNFFRGKKLDLYPIMWKIIYTQLSFFFVFNYVKNPNLRFLHLMVFQLSTEQSSKFQTRFCFDIASWNLFIEKKNCWRLSLETFQGSIW